MFKSASLFDDDDESESLELSLQVEHSESLQLYDEDVAVDGFWLAYKLNVLPSLVSVSVAL